MTEPELTVHHVHSQLAAIVHSSHDAIISKTLEGVITFWNEAAERLYGYPAQEIVGRNAEILCPEPRRGEQASILEQIARGQRLDQCVTDRVHRDGRTVTVFLSTSPILDGEGRIVGAASISRDVGRLSRACEKNLELEKEHLAKIAFLASMSHELRTPLNAIIGFTGTLLMGMPGPLNEAQIHQLRLVETSGRHLLSLVNDLLDLAKIESGKVEVTLEPVDCHGVVEEVAASMRPLAEQRGITLTTLLPDEPCLAIADRRALGQILLNLVHNAIKFTTDGEVRITLTRACAGEQWAVEVSDTGPGIPAEDQARIFGAFERGASARKHGDEGTGLGLYISHKLAELMGLHLRVTSVPGAGSTFSVRPAC